MVCWQTNQDQRLCVQPVNTFPLTKKAMPATTLPFCRSATPAPEFDSHPPIKLQFSDFARIVEKWGRKKFT